MKKMLKKLKIEELKKEKKFLGRICLFFLLATLSYAIFYSYSLYLDKYVISKEISHIKENIAKKKVGKFDNIETKIFDLRNYNQEIKASETKELNTYSGQKIPDSQRIEFLENEVYELKKRLEQISDLNGQTALIISYIYLRQKIFSHFDNDLSYYEELKNFEILSEGDEFLNSHTDHLKSILRKKITQEYLIETFDNVADKFASSKEFEGDSNLLNKIKENLLKIIVIRKVSEKNYDSVDGKVSRVIKDLKNQNYNQVNRTLLSMDNKYRIIAESFLMDLNYMIALKRIDSEILAYLSNNK